MSSAIRSLSQAVTVPPPLPGLSPAQLLQIQNKDQYLREKHIQLENSLSGDDRDHVRRKRMIYRSKQRGWLEVDLLLGSFAVIHVPSMTTSQLDEYEEILKEETIDTFNYVTGKDPLPSYLVTNSVMKRLQEYTSKSEMTTPEAYAIIKQATNLT
jgi:succinate dehydrogenase assembly factor 2